MTPLAFPGLQSPSTLPLESTLTHIGEGVCFGTFGELLQGALPPDGTDFLVTLPVERYSRATFTRSSQDRDLTVEPASKSKSRRLAGEILARFGLPIAGHVRIQSDIPEGKGLASSSADLVATARAITFAYGLVLRCSELEELLRDIEPTDGVMYPGCVCYRHRDVHLHEHLGFLPEMEILALDEGGIVDTVSFNERDKRYLVSELAEFEVLLGRTRKALREGDLSNLGQIATRSAELNQRLNPKRHFEAVTEAAREVAALGIATSHSGTYLGLLFAHNDPQLAAKIRHAARLLDPLVASMDQFTTWKGALPAPRAALDWRTNLI